MTSSIYAIEDVIHRNETISSITLDDAGTNFENPEVTIDPPTNGTTATATAISSGPLFALDLIARGNNYTSTPTVKIKGTGSGATASAIFGVVNAIGITFEGDGYTSATVSIDAPPSPGVQATAIAVINDSHIESITVTNGGSGYDTRPNVAISDPQAGNKTATALATGTFGQVDSISIVANGTGYDNDTVSVEFTGGGGTGASALATIRGPVQSPITITNGGSGYTGVPFVSIDDVTGPGMGANATAVIEAIDADENILDNDIVITNDMVKPGGGGILRVYFSFEFLGDANSTIAVYNNNVFKGNLNADNSSVVVDGGFYRFDLDVEVNDSLNFQSSVDIDSVNFIRTHLVQFGA